MNLYYRIAVISGAFWIYAGLITRKILQIRSCSRREGFRCQNSERLRNLRTELIRTCADFLILVLICINPLEHGIFSFEEKESYAGFVAVFSTFTVTSLAVSLFVDRVLRQRFYREHSTDMNTRLNDFSRNAVSVLFIASGALVFDFITYLVAKAGATIPWQVILPVLALLYYFGTFRIILYFRNRRNRNSAEKPLKVRIRERRIPWLIRVLQGGCVLFFWIRIVLHIEQGDFPPIEGVQDNIASGLCIATLITAAVAICFFLQIICNSLAKRRFQA